MGLEKYKEKRRLNQTPEPSGGRASGQALHFVIQKHNASHLHYDFRLEVKGVLKSWAVPKGPSTDPSVKRLAMLVEDHPYDYKDFEGIIPEGNYGAGTVIIWDQGTYETVENLPDKKAREKSILKQFFSGEIKIILHGQKLNGRFTLVKAPGRGDNSWLLIKGKDEYASKADITRKDKSVESDQTIETMAGNPNASEWESNRKSSAKKSSASTKINLQARGIKASMPTSISPMLCTLTKEPLIDPDYLYEIKWDGYRIISYVNGKQVRLDSRSALDYTKKYPPVVAALKALNHKVVLDGEIVVFNDQGHPDFDALQKYNGHDTPIHYCVFDILWLDGYDLRKLPLTERKGIVKGLLADNAIIRFSESFDDGAALYRQVIQMNLEGMIAKKKDSTYNAGERGNNWLKTPTRKSQEFVIGGWAESERGRSFRSLLFGAYNDKGELEWIGRSGGGYKEQEMPGILNQLKKLEIDQSPFVNRVLDTKGATMHWVKPQLVANFQFATWTKSGRIRKPATFLGFRKDKKAEQVVREVPKPVEVIEEQLEDETEKGAVAAKKNASAKQQPNRSGGRKYLNAGSNWKKVDEEQKDAEWTHFEMANCTIPVHNPERELWTGVSKGDLLLYYTRMADIILPYVKDHPQSLVLKLTNAGGPRLFIKDMENRQPECAEVMADKRRLKKAGKRTQIDYLVCNNKETLVYMIDLGCVDLNTWASRMHHIEEPDYIWLDLDPTIADGLKGKQLESAEQKGFAKAVRVAKATKEIIDKHKLKGFIKTSGQTGLHIYIPCSGLNFEQTRMIASAIADEVHASVPDISTRNESKSQRGENVYIDAGQNDYADTLAAPYCVRPYHQPLVSTPIDWKELSDKLNRYDFTIHTIPDRLKRKGDLFKGILSDAVVKSNNKALQKFI